MKKTTGVKELCPSANKQLSSMKYGSHQSRDTDEWESFLEMAATPWLEQIATHKNISFVEGKTTDE